MSEAVPDRVLPLAVVDARALGPELRRVLRPGELLADREGRLRRLPSFFYEVPSWQTARETYLSPHFALWEFISVDVREAEAQRGFPRYVPCAVTLLAAHLEVFRERVKTYVRIAANGGYRTPAHVLSTHASAHCWGTAANVYRVGDEYVDDQEKVDRFGAIATRALPALWARPYGHGVGFADDHLHLDIGYVTLVPRDAPGEDGG
jgi:hypothetical protein